MSAGYELLYLISSTKSQEELALIKDNVIELLAKEGAEVVHHDVWSVRKLAYPIKKVEHAFYVLCYFTLKKKSAENVKKGLQLMADVVRSLIIRHDDAKEAHEAFVKHLKDSRAKKQASKEAVVAPSLPTPAKSPIVSKVVPKIVKSEEIKLPKFIKTEVKEMKKEEVKEEKEKTASKKRASLEDLDKKLDDILGGDIEL